jgi:hypothetical protein
MSTASAGDAIASLQTKLDDSIRINDEINKISEKFRKFTDTP